MLDTSGNTELAFAKPGQRVTGTYLRCIDLPSGSFAAIQSGQSITLAPWSPGLDKLCGRTVSGIPSGDTLSWIPAKARGLGLGI